MNIPAYILIKSNANGLNFYYYLHIKGGAGGFYRKRMGGEFDYILFYASPEQMEGCSICEKIWCEENNIHFGEGKTIELAYENYLKKQKKKHSVAHEI